MQNYLGVTMAIAISEQQRANFMKVFNADNTKTKKTDPNEVALPDGSVVTWNDAEYGDYIRQNFSVLYFLFQDHFAQYRLAHAMGPIIENLKPGLDKVSLEYLERTWTAEDQKRKTHYDACKENNPLLQKLSLDYGSIHVLTIKKRQNVA